MMAMMIAIQEEVKKYLNKRSSSARVHHSTGEVKGNQESSRGKAGIPFSTFLSKAPSKK
jgi:hypothetical protein